MTTTTRNSIATLIATDTIEAVGAKNVKRVYGKALAYMKTLKTLIEQAERNFDYIEVLSTVMDVAYAENDKNNFIESYKKLEDAIDLMDDSDILKEFRKEYEKNVEEIQADESAIL